MSLSVHAVEPVVELGERDAQPLDLVLGERASLHAPDRLSLHQVADKLGDDEHELGEPFLQRVGVRVDPSRQRLRWQAPPAGRREPVRPLGA